MSIKFQTLNAMAKSKAIKIGIDWLKVCCRQNPELPLWDELKNGRKYFGQNKELMIKDISRSMLRIDAVVTTLDENGDYKRLAELTVYPHSEESNISSDMYGRAFLRLYNEWLYQPEGIGYLMGALSNLHLEFNNITRLDIALTSIHVNFSRFILKAIREPSIDMVYRGRVWHGTDAEAIPELCVTQSISRKGKIRNAETIYCGMAKGKDVQMCSYNKNAELSSNDDVKRSTLCQWLELPVNSRSPIYRLEVQLRNEDLSEQLETMFGGKHNVDYMHLRTGGILWKIMDEKFLFRLMYYGLHRIMHFRKGRKLLSIFDICNLDGVLLLN
ncbi:MAG: hypothetical protein IKP02_03350 [Paludibacteraceae bacterium]|nr:hypothetical protein [Paludibacteraceae bacterium]